MGTNTSPPIVDVSATTSEGSGADQSGLAQSSKKRRNPNVRTLLRETVQVKAAFVDSWFLSMSISQYPVSMLVDTGSEVTVLKQGCFNEIPIEVRPKLAPCKVKLRGVGGAFTETHGMADITYAVGGIEVQCQTLM